MGKIQFSTKAPVFIARAFVFLFFNSGFGINTKTIFIFSDILIIINELRIKEQKQRKKNKKRLEKKFMELKEFAKMLNGKEYGYPQFTKEELQIAKDNGFVIVSGASDDLVELEGAIIDEGDCFDGGRLYVKAIPGGGFVHNYERSNVFSFEARWCMDKDENGNIISWTYDTSIVHENFMIYEDGEPYCRGFVFRVVDENN